MAFEFRSFRNTLWKNKFIRAERTKTKLFREYLAEDLQNMNYVVLNPV